METMNIVKIDTQKLKSEIKELSEKQKFYRNQRKTVHIVGERQMLASEAWYQHHISRNKLRIMYAAYGIARGKSFSQIENNFPDDNHPLTGYQKQIDSLLKKYEVE